MMAECDSEAPAYYMYDMTQLYEQLESHQMRPVVIPTNAQPPSCPCQLLPQAPQLTIVDDLDIRKGSAQRMLVAQVYEGAPYVWLSRHRIGCLFG